jgi:hypothetical protein
MLIDRGNLKKLKKKFWSILVNLPTKPAAKGSDHAFTIRSDKSKRTSLTMPTPTPSYYRNDGILFRLHLVVDNDLMAVKKQ